jgi:hypothetical protein
MNIQENKWLLIKSSLLILGVVSGRGGSLEVIDNPPPFWVFFIVFFTFAGLLPFYLKAFQKTKRYVNNSLWQSSPLRPFSDPLPFYHLCAWAGVVTGGRDMAESLLSSKVYDMSYAWFSLAAGTGCFVALWITQYSINKSITVGEPDGTFRQK